ncbi:hypothetical protein [Corynebacterium striatum]|uniref:hypothetical protein n=1 Tax=Corynebacterium striatum TaxID=43770 RepID=UPI000D753F86|nr:hypothetical protein [Corynebacterium striatum]PXY04598.1 hypothetical protein CKF53_09215 [Corynebacterium striatum]
MHPLVANGGELTVLRSLAAFSYGSWNVSWPESVPEDQRPVLPDDRDFGYAARLKDEPGRMGRRFVRANTTISAAEYKEDGSRVEFTGSSDVEQVLDAAAKRTDGEAFIEREFDRSGLGRLVPRLDFSEGDIVPVLIWGKLFSGPVESITDVVAAGQVVGWSVHVGGELVTDDLARRRSNRDLQASIAQERRERLKDLGAVDSKASAAQSSADAAQGTADSAVGDAAALREVLSGAGASADDVRSQLGELNRKIQERGESQDSLPLIPAYIAANTARWRVQDELDALQDEQIALTRRLAEANRKALEIQAEMNAVFARRRPQVLSFSKNGAGNDLVSVKTGGNLTVTAKGSWTGVIAVSARVDALSAYAINDAVEVSSWRRSWEWKVGTFESSGGGYVIIMPN